jgi:hypothetical protein
MHTDFRWRNLMEIYDLTDLGANGKVILKRSFKKYYASTSAEFIRLRRGKSGRLL